MIIIKPASRHTQEQTVEEVRVSVQLELEGTDATEETIFDLQIGSIGKGSKESMLSKRAFRQNQARWVVNWLQ
jgi:hypothetical protein